MWDCKKIVDGYLKNYREEMPNLNTLYAQLESGNSKSLIDRKNFLGHVTASAFVVTKDSKEVLMIHHKALKRYLQPGGHIEASDRTPLQAAQRELFEETGVDASWLTYQSLSPLDELLPFNISIHLIPANSKVNEAAHDHYDFQYLFSCDQKQVIHLDEKEVTSYEWLGWDLFKEMPGTGPVVEKIDRLWLAAGLNPA